MKTCLLGTLVVLLLLICLCIGGYGYLYYRFPPKHWEPRFGVELNPLRAKLGIPAIPTGWEPRARQYETTWRSPLCREEENVNQRKLEDRFKPCHREKIVWYWPKDYPESDRIPDVIKESDLYLGPGYVKVLGGSLEREFVMITCQYEPDNPAWMDCTAVALVANRFQHMGDGEKIDVNTAIQILNEWEEDYP